MAPNFPFCGFLQPVTLAWNAMSLENVIWVVVMVMFTRQLVASMIAYRDPALPFINNRKWYEITYYKAKSRFLKHGASLLRRGFDKADAFYMVMDNGVVMVLHPKYANEIRLMEGLSFSESLAADFHAHIPGFDPFTARKLILDVIRTRLTKKLEYSLQPLSTETSIALERWGIGWQDWQSLPLREAVLGLIAQLTSNTLLSCQIGYDPQWCKIMANYTVDAFVAAYILRMFPKLLRPIASRFIPHCRKLRREIEAARRIINPVLHTRQPHLVRSCTYQDGVYEDAFDWLEQCANGQIYDPVIAQLSLSVVAIHTTSDMLTQVLFDLAQRPRVISALRREILEVFGNQSPGLTRGSLQKLKVMDSVMKESQRLKPVNIVSMRRKANYDIRLSDGTLIPKGTMLCVSNHWMWDPAVYPNPEEFDAYRFCRSPESPRYDFASKFVAPSPEHLGFGLGRHVCPGRFFATAEIKIILCHLLLRYDIELPEGFQPKVFKTGAVLSADPNGVVLIRRRWNEDGDEALD